MQLNSILYACQSNNRYAERNYFWQHQKQNYTNQLVTIPILVLTKKQNE